MLVRELMSAAPVSLEAEEPVAEHKLTSAVDRIHPANSDQKIQEP